MRQPSAGPGLPAEAAAFGAGAPGSALPPRWLPGPVVVGILLAAGVLALPPPPSQAQTGLPDFDQEWRWADFDRTSGFLGGTVREVLEARDTLWARTDEALYWYAGFSWNRMGPAEGLPQGPHRSLAADSSGSLVAVVGDRVYTGGSGGFVPLDLPGLDGSRYSLRRAAPVSQGLVVSGWDHGERRTVVFLADSTGLREITPEGGVAYASNLWRTPSGEVFLNGDRGLARRTGEEWRLLRGSAEGDNLVPVLWEAPDGRGFAHFYAPLGLRGLATWPPGGSAVMLPADGGENRVLSGATTSDGLVFLIYETGDVRVLEGGRWWSVSLPASRREAVSLVFADSRGDLWFASARGIHLFRRSLNRWASLRQPFPDPRNRINGILPRPDGTLWLATGDGLLRLRDGRAEEWVRTIRGTGLGGVTGLAADHAGAIWITSGAAFEGAFRWSEEGWSRVGPAEGLDVGFVHRVVTASDGALWFLSLGNPPDSRGAGAYRWKDGALERWVDDRGILDARTYAFAEGPDGSYWFGTFRGAARWKDGSWSGWGLEEGVGTAEYGRVFTLLPDSAGGAWIGHGPGSHLGLGFLHPDGRVRYRTGEPDLPNDNVNEIARDSSGVVWISTDGGLARLKGGEYAVLDGSSGLSPVRSWPVAFRGSSVLVGTTGGGLQILDRGEEASPPPQVELLGPVTVEGRVVRIHFRVQAFRGEVPGPKVLVRDRLDGGGWGAWGTYRELWTTPANNLKHGPHLWEFQARGLNGQLSEPLAVDFSVPYPLFLRPLFLAPVGSMAVAVVALLLMARRRKARAEDVIRAREQRFRTLVETAPDGISIYDADANRFLTVNEKLLEMTGATREESLIAPLGGRSPELLPEGRSSRDVLRGLVDRALAGEQPMTKWSLVAKDGREIPVEMRLARLPSEEGRLVRFSMLDVRDRMEAERRREELEGQLRQSQKLEAVGQLTGGVAHDFNNLLTVIMGNLDLLLEARKGDHEVQELARGAMGAAERSALLTQRLLAFSRQQTLNTRAVDLERLVHGLMDLLRRSLGETIEIRAEFQPGLWAIEADPGQLEHALINLAVNARDAMPRGGTLHLEARNAEVGEEEVGKWGGRGGEFVLLSVTDTGEGMDAAVRERAFDPFFTTKEVGKGSGLGLSMVYGFVKQLGGYVDLLSQRGEGTTVRLYLPRSG